MILVGTKMTSRLTNLAGDSVGYRSTKGVGSCEGLAVRDV